MLMIHKPKDETNEKAIITTSSESHFHWKNDFHKNPLYFRIIADFEADIEIEDSKAIGIKTTNINKQNPVCNGYYIKSE